MLFEFEHEWSKPREYSFTNAAEKVFYEIAYCQQDLRMFAEMHKATSYPRVAYPIRLAEMTSRKMTLR